MVAANNSLQHLKLFLLIIIANTDTPIGPINLCAITPRALQVV